MTDPDPLVDSVIGDRYRVLAPLGRGGMGAVYRVEHLMMKKELALKLLHPELGRLDEVAKRFEREAEAAARLSHANIVNVTDFGRTPDGRLFLVMELLAGPSLSEVIHPSGEDVAVEPARALHILAQILRALDHAHAAGIVHRDLKPDNIVLVERDGDRDFVKLLDFGIAKITDRSSESLTQAGVVFGTPEYLSPEQAMGEDADGRADLYAAGVILYELLTGKRPYQAESRVEVISMHLTRPVPTLPAALSRYQPILLRAMAKKREERYASAAQFLAAVQAPRSEPAALSQLAGRAVSASSHAMSALVWRAREAGVPWPRAFIAGALLLALSLVLIVATSLRPGHHGEAERHFQLGNSALEKGERDQALDEYRLALQLDDSYRKNSALRANLAAMLDRRPEGPAALSLLVDVIGKPALPEVVACAKLCKDDKVRRRAAEAAAQLGGPPLPNESLDEDVDKLRTGRGCRERKAAALKLIAADDRRYLDSLRAARDRHGGFLGLEEINGCMRRELDAAIRKLESK